MSRASVARALLSQNGVPTLIAQLVFKPRVTELLHGAPEPEMDPGVLVA
jgi:hypothetical protein